MQKPKIFSGRKLRTARLSAELSLRKLAYRLNVSSTTTSRWESYVCAPSSDRLPQIAAILDVKIEDLFEEVPDEVQD